MKDRVKIQVIRQGKPIVGDEGYMLINGGNVVAFCLDGWGDTGRIYPVSTYSSTYIEGMIYNYPSMNVEDGDDDSSYTEIAFPEYEDFYVHSVSGGKTMQICLVKELRIVNET